MTSIRTWKQSLRVDDLTDDDLLEVRIGGL